MRYPCCVESRNNPVAAAPRGPAKSASRTTRPLGLQGARSAIARSTTEGMLTAWQSVSGHQPAVSGIWPRAAKSSPKPRPASTPSTRPAATDSRFPGAPSGSSGVLETSQMPGRAATIPTQTMSDSRSPVIVPASTGTTAAPTAETGATTPIRPAEKPR